MVARISADTEKQYSKRVDIDLTTIDFVSRVITMKQEYDNLILDKCFC